MRTTEPGLPAASPPDPPAKTITNTATTPFSGSPSSDVITVAITGASGALGQALLRRWHQQGARLIAITSRETPLELLDRAGMPIPHQHMVWQVGEEQALIAQLKEVDVLVLNHGVNVHQGRSAANTQLSLEVNALSSWRMLELFATQARGRRAEVWLNTSEAEIQPALSPLYEISKRLLGQLISLRALDLSPSLRIRRLVLGPFRSALNPIGVMDADFVAGQILMQARFNLGLIIVTPNPLTYALMPLVTLGRWLYFKACSRTEPQ